MEGFYPDVWQSADTALSTGDKHIFAPGVPVDVIAWGLTVTADIDADADSQIQVKADKQVKGGARGDGDVGTLSGGLDTDYDDGEVLFITSVSPDADIPTQPHQLNAGDRIYFQVTDAADSDAGDAVFWVLYQRRATDLEKADDRTLAQGNRNANTYLLNPSS